ncbi:unnamed protein product, partial [Ilex paraguariensis]
MVVADVGLKVLDLIGSDQLVFSPLFAGLYTLMVALAAVALVFSPSSGSYFQLVLTAFQLHSQLVFFRLPAVQLLLFIAAACSCLVLLRSNFLAAAVLSFLAGLQLPF